jgi:hypothetical protein
MKFEGMTKAEIFAYRREIVRWKAWLLLMKTGNQQIAKMLVLSALNDSRN